MAEAPETDELMNAVNDFHAALDAKPDQEDLGSIQRWAEQSGRAFEKLDSLIDQRRHHLHERLFSEMADQSPTEGANINELRTADEEIDQLLDVVKTQVIVLTVPKTDAAEGRLGDEATELVERGVNLINWIQEQEQSVSQWFAEAFARHQDL